MRSNRKQVGPITLVRRKHIQPPDLIRKGQRIAPAPELGGILTGLEFSNALQIDSFRLKTPRTVSGIRATQRVEVWAMQGGKRSQLVEEWFAASVPPEYPNLADYVATLLRAEAKELSAKATAAARELLICKSPHKPTVDVGQSQRAVVAELLRREYPQLHRALDTKLRGEEIRKAYIADLVAVHGHAPDLEPGDNLLQDSGFIRWLASALSRPGSKVSSTDWMLATGWIRDSYYLMTDAQLAAELNPATGRNLSGASWAKQAQRLGLVNARAFGRPESRQWSDG